MHTITAAVPTPTTPCTPHAHFLCPMVCCFAQLLHGRAAAGPALGKAGTIWRLQSDCCVACARAVMMRFGRLHLLLSGDSTPTDQRCSVNYRACMRMCKALHSASTYTTTMRQLRLQPHKARRVCMARCTAPPHAACWAAGGLELHEMRPVAILQREACAQVSLELRRQRTEQRGVHCLLVGNVLSTQRGLGLLCRTRGCHGQYIRVRKRACRETWASHHTVLLGATSSVYRKKKKDTIDTDR
jgi:hypothetical protein